MAIKIENQAERKLPRDTEKHLEAAFDSLPREHTRGLERIRLVEFISDPRIRNTFQASELPGLYHPRQGPKGAWLEVAVGVLLRRTNGSFPGFRSRVTWRQRSFRWLASTTISR